MENKDLIVLGINKSHNASAALLVNGEIVYHLESERISNMKHDPFPFQAIGKIKDYVDHIDVLAIAGLSKTNKEFDRYRMIDAYSAHIVSLSKSFSLSGFEIFDFGMNHHATHAYSSFYNSGFDQALCIVKDGMGSDFYFNFKEGKEIGSAFIMSYPDKISIVEKHIAHRASKLGASYWIDSDTLISNSLSEGAAFEVISKVLGFSVNDAGKTMGLAPYGKYNKKFDFIYQDGLINVNYFNYDHISLLPKYSGPIPENFEEGADLAYAIQSSVEKNVIEYILKMIEKTKQKNVCLSGGLFLNCSMNYKIAKSLPEDVNLYIEPISGDAGTAIGVAKFIHFTKTKSFKKMPQKNIYYGPQYNYSLDYLKNKKIKFVQCDKKEVAKKISDGAVVAIFQGRSESGPRALGNRSILYDPRDPNGKNKVNQIKKREPFRPFAGTVLEELASEWFDMDTIKSSPYMLFAVKVVKEKREKIPAITHVDGTCRVQTVNQEQNKNFYELIKEFYNITGVPILFNTSFNLAGDCIVETIDDSLATLYNSSIDYLYLPELEVLIYG